jgi:hypothetical protein
VTSAAGTTTAGTTTNGDSTSRRATWALWGTAAGALGAVTNLGLSFQHGDGLIGVDVVDRMSRGIFHAAAVTGYLAAAALLLFAAGLWRWADRQATSTLALRAAPMALVAAAGSLFVGYGVKGQLAEYLPGGMNPDNYPPEGLYVFMVTDDLAGFYSWSALTVALACLAWLSLRERLLPRWVGVVAAVVVVPPVLFLLVSGFTGFSGIVGPLGLAVVATGIALRRE